MSRNRLPELVPGVTILAIIAAVAAPRIVRAIATADEAQALADSRTVMAAEEAYASANFGFFAPLENLCSGATCSGIGIANYSGPDFISSDLGRPGPYLKDGYYRTWSPDGAPAALPMGADPLSSLNYCYASEPEVVQLPAPQRAFSVDPTGHLYEDPYGSAIACPVPPATWSAPDTFQRHLALDFGCRGLYHYAPSGGFTQLSAWDPELITAWSEGIAVSFGPGYGLWSYDRDGWEQLSPWTPYLMTSAGGRLFAAFDSGRGIWTYDATGSTQITNQKPALMTPFGNRLAVAFGSGEGIQIWSPLSGWLQLSSWDPYAMWDVNAYLFAAFDGGRGIQMHGSGWVLYVEHYGYPTSWEMVSSWEPEELIQFNMTSTHWAITGDFGAGRGIWRVSPWRAYEQLHTEDPYLLLTHERDLVAAFSGQGLHLYDETNGWNALTPWDPTHVVSAEEYLAAAFDQGRGVYRYDSSGWTQISRWTAESIVAYRWDAAGPDVTTPEVVPRSRARRSRSRSRCPASAPSPPPTTEQLSDRAIRRR